MYKYKKIQQIMINNDNKRVCLFVKNAYFVESAIVYAIT